MCLLSSFCREYVHIVLIRSHFSCKTFLLSPAQIKERLLQLTDKRKEMIDKWEDRWEWLRLGNPS